MPLSAQTPDGIIELSGGSLAVGIGYTWGSGTLIVQGRRYSTSAGLSVSLALGGMRIMLAE